jgi:hypothetical protein
MKKDLTKDIIGFTSSSRVILNVGVKTRHNENDWRVKFRLKLDQKKEDHLLLVGY